MASPKTSITSVPETVLRSVFDDDALSHEDIIALRLTCRAFVRAANSILFRRIYISQLYHDRDIFVAICNSPHLAEHVYEIEWQEVSWFPGYFTQLPDLGSAEEGQDMEFRNMVEELDLVADQLFWLPALSLAQPDLNGDTVLIRRDQAISEFVGEFCKSLQLLPNLCTAISQAMPEDRLLWCSEYPFEVKGFQDHHLSIPGEYCAWEHPGSDGLHHFLLPAMESLDHRPITRLLWHDESHGASYLRPLPSKQGFRNLVSMNLSFNPKSSRDSYAHIQACLEACKYIRHLALELRDCFQYSTLQSKLLRIDDDGIPQWYRLNSISLSNFCFLGRHGQQLLSLIKRSEENLSHLYLEDTEVSFSLIKELARGCSRLSLRSLRIWDNSPSSESVYVPEDMLLNYVNSGTTSGLASANEAFDQNRFDRYLEDSRATRYLFTFDGEEASKQESMVETVDERDEEEPSEAHLANAPRWDFDRFYHEDEDDGEVWVFRIGQESRYEGYATQLWKFTNRDGEVAYGRHPLDWWEDWEPNEGDLAEPTPYCDDLFYFVAERQKIFMAGYESLRPPPGAVRQARSSGIGRHTLPSLMPAKGQTFEITLPIAMASGRVYFAQGELEYFMVKTATGDGLVQPFNAFLENPSRNISWALSN
ncbi:unnamed protein product [Clonostachys rosea]|uniref:GH64 domain-containing protein n=1 Tax=Bionectria ochroleuca TaxID=29856 RepID=A0ABY6U5H4_BIOOC|nr:unnamed protein product [Clonostachys rosea]